MSTKDTPVLDFSDPAINLMVRRAVANAKGSHYFELRKARDTRTLQQNRYWHSTMCFRFAIGMTQAWGQTYTPWDAHCFLKNRFLKVPVFNAKTGEEMGFVERSTTDMDTVEFSELWEKVHDMALDYLGVDIPPPDKNWRAAKETKSKAGAA